MELHKVVRLDDMPETLRIGMYYKDDALADIENGKFVELGALLDGEREIYKVTDATADSTGLVGVVCTPELEYDEHGYHGIETFINKKGKTVRIAIFRKGFRFSITDEAYSVGDEITVGGKKLQCIAVEKVGRLTYYVLQVM